MTNEEIIKDMQKFCAYLKANGVRPLAHSILVEVDGKAISFSNGNAEMVSTLSIIALADLSGLRVADK